MIQNVLSDGRIKYEIPGWTGYRDPDKPMTKTKWFKDGVKYWEVEGTSSTYIVTLDTLGKINCECRGFTFRKKCKHIDKIKKTKEI